VFLLMRGATAKRAMAELSLRYGHIRQARTGILDRFFELYQAEAEGKKGFLDWVREDYDEEALRGAFKAGRVAGFINDRLLARE
jgi:hypothetical protein